ncbi:MAG: fructose-bisphosphate aldolase [Candidatus Doudnabacteria bacterium RIFCSPHIGHO2_01_FULL_43_23]|uniref:Fructose-bisphosphate aldolase n=1 Tax=Candidatus Doudnabacteria bacterium RIFCSPHIGHO2_01_FULL_43_23 TaxID=1817822 RepID=A0A1F5NVY5_9BACT|nr:MAG: fructose-bisphosphate aldolase [Candidatus Doudnabacteria bacterium RIFCSPHIGHO2_01_FULL_43_23]
MEKDILKKTAEEMVAPGKGILAADESLPTIEKRFDSINIESTEENRRAYRDVIFTTQGIEKFISGVIMFDETLRHSAGDGVPFPKLLASRGIIPGIKVDMGAKELEGSPEEKLTIGLDGLYERLLEYKKLGARFAKWRAVIVIGEGIPTDKAIELNAEALAEYADVCQKAGIVPMIEPEVLMDGDHSIERDEEFTTKVLKATYKALRDKGVYLEGSILKPNMVLSGKSALKQASVPEVAETTLRVLQATVPKEVTGITFLSGGQSNELATARLNAMNKMGKQPWEISFSYSRALLGPVLGAWQGKEENRKVAQDAFYKRARLNSLARQGKYAEEMEKE